jgi:hypothetical protein
MSRVSAYKFKDDELAALKVEFASFDTSGDGRSVASTSNSLPPVSVPNHSTTNPHFLCCILAALIRPK